MAADIPALTYRDLELSLDRADHGLFRVRLRGLGMDRTPLPISLDIDGITALRDDPAHYGRRLGEILFAVPSLADAFGQAKGSAFAIPGHGLRLRLVIPPDVSELHRLAWETLVVPGDDMPLAMDERVIFSRCLGGQDLVAAPAHNASPKIVAAIASPVDLADPIDVAGELERLRSSLGDLAITELIDDHATFDDIGQALADGADVLYLACHGLFDQDTPLLVLEGPDRQTALVSGKGLAAAVRRLPRKPSLVVLASCQSAGAGEGEVLAATGPLLVDAGVPAVVAMQGSVRVDTVAQWLPAFWRAWRKDGAVDRAVAAARWAVREQLDLWMPVAFVRMPAEQPAPKRRRADFYKHINLPPHYVPRPSLLAEIKQTLLAEHDAGKPVALTSAIRAHVDALHGMGGIGKTVAARVLCDDPDVQAAYPNGILWITVGQTPDLIPQLRDWIRELGGIVSENVPTVASLKNLLAELLTERACLLIVDDVWRVEDAQVFTVPAPGCRVVMTTRDAAVAEEIGAAVQPIPLMALEEAVELLRAWAGNGLDGVSGEQAVAVVERLGRLPLAIKLAGPQLREVEPATWLQEFDVRNLEARRGDGPHRSLEVAFGLSVDRLPEQHRHLYAALTIFPEDEPIPKVAIERLWGELGELPTRQVRRLLRDLADRALVQMAAAGEGGDAAISLHDLLRDMMALKLGEAGAIATHAALLAAYRQTQTGKGWHTAPDDGYLYGHLAYHLEKIAASDLDATADLEQLFADDEWMRVRIVVDDYRYDGFLADLDRVWAELNRSLSSALSNGSTTLAIGQSLRYALIRSSIYSLSNNYAPELVIQAVTSGLWSIARGLSVAARVSDERHRATLFAALVGSGLCDREQSESAMRACLDAACAIQYVEQRASGLAAVAHNLEGETKERALRAGLDAALAIQFEGDQSRALVALAPNLYGELLRAGLDAALAIQDEGSRSRALAALAPSLHGETKENALRNGLNAALVIRDEWERICSLAALAPNLQGDIKEYMLREGLNAAMTNLSDRHRTYALAALAPNLHGKMKDNAVRAGLDAALAIDDERGRSLALASIAPYLQGELLQIGLDATLAIQSAGERTDALVALSSNLRGTLLRTGLDAALAIQHVQLRSRALAALAPNLQGETLRIVLETALTINDEWGSSIALAAVACYLQGETKKNTLKAGMNAALAIHSERERTDTLVALAPNLRGELLRAGLDAALAIQSIGHRVRALTAFAPNLQDHLLRIGLDAAVAIQDEGSRSRALAALAPSLHGDLLQIGLDAALAMRDDWHRSSALATLAPCLQGNLLRIGLDAALAIQDEESRSRVLAALAPSLQGKMKYYALRAGLDAALAIQDERYRSRALADLAPSLQGKMKQYALHAGLDAALAIQDEGSRSIALAALAPNLQGDLLRTGLDAALAIRSEYARQPALLALAPNIQGISFRARDSAPLFLEHDLAQLRALTALLHGSINYTNPSQIRHKITNDLYTTLRESPRIDILSYLATPNLIASPLFTPDEIGAVAEAIIDVTTKWRWL